jgi:hypothetical protein
MPQTLVAVRESPQLPGATPGKQRFLVSGLSIGGVIALTLLLTLASRHAVVGDSDGATIVLEGKAMASGHLLLHGWTLSLDSFWTLDALPNMLATSVLGLRPLLLNLVPAALSALVVLCGALLARRGVAGAAAVSASAAVVAVLALPGHAMAAFYLRGGMHVGTTLACLLSFAALVRNAQSPNRGRRTAWWAVSVVLLGAGIVGDLQVLALGVVPVLLAGVSAALRTRRWRAGASAVGAAVASGALAMTADAILRSAGGFRVVGGDSRAPSSMWIENVRRAGTDVARLLGAGSGPLGTGGVPAGLQAVHVVTVVVMGAGVLWAVGSLLRGIVSGPEARGRREAEVRHELPELRSRSREWPGLVADRLLEDALLFGALADLAVFVVLDTGTGVSAYRFLLAGLVFGAVLSGRMVGQFAEWLAERRTGDVSARARGRPALTATALAGVAVLSAFCVGFALTLRGAVPARPAEALASLLEAHGLHDGVGDYWSASVTTVDSGGKVDVRPVVADASGRLVRYARESGASWYGNAQFRFVVFDTAVPYGVSAAAASSTFGTPAETYSIGTYRVLVWAHPFRIAAR